PATVDSGKTPITIRAASLALAHRRAAPPPGDMYVTIPTHGRLADERAVAISAFAQHPNAAKLWLEFLLSDDGQNILLDGDCLPIRLEAMQQSNAIPTELLAQIPDSSGAVFPSGPQVTKAIDAI